MYRLDYRARKAAREIAAADDATFVLREGDDCHYVDEDALGPLFKGKHFPANICISGAAMAEKRKLVVPDILKDSRIPQEVYRSTFVKSLCMTPIRAQYPVGAIGVYWKDFHATTEEEALSLSILANSCSIALENVHLQTQLRARLDQIHRMSRLKEDFLRNLSHELRTPLNQILGWAQLLREGGSPEEIREGLEGIDQSGRRQEAVIKDLLDCSALVLGEMSYEPENFDLGELLAPLLQNFRVAIESKKLRMEITSESTGTIVHADRRHCTEILRHLLSNAIKFSSQGSTIRLSCRHDENDSVVEVTDEGIDIDPQFLPHVFDLFAQDEGGYTRAYSGTGLGLSISRFLAEAQGGAVEVESDGRDLGVTATVRLPTAAIRFVRKRNADPAYMSHVMDHLMRPEALRVAKAGQSRAGQS